MTRPHTTSVACTFVAPARFVTATEYVPASLITAPEIVSSLVLAPLIRPPFLSGVPFRLHKYASGVFPAADTTSVTVAPPSTLESLRPEADEIVCVSSPEDLGAVGAFYADFQPIEDEIVIDLLRRAAASIAKPVDTTSSP